MFFLFFIFCIIITCYIKSSKFIYEYTKTIWLPILLHFINNAVAIVGLYLVKNDVQKTNQLMDEGMPIYWGLVAAVAVVFLLLQLKKSTPNERLDNDILQ